MSQNTNTGRQGEFLAAYILETHGIEVHHVDRTGTDLWCKLGHGHVTDQFKSCSQPKQTNDRSNLYYTFKTQPSDADYYAFVALDRELLVVRVNDHDAIKTTTRLLAYEFNATNQRRSIQDMLQTS